MHDMHIRIVDQCLVISVTLASSELLCLRSSGIFIAGGDGYEIRKTEAPHCIDVMWSDESRPDYSHANALLHQSSNLTFKMAAK